jgi:ATP-dependent Clp protease protease subunit
MTDFRVSLGLDEHQRLTLMQRGIVVFNDDIDSNSLDEFQSDLLYVASLGLPQIKVVLTTNGGALDCAFGMYDLIRHIDQTLALGVHTVAVGYCYSAGVIVLQAGRQRLATPNATLMIHETLTIQFGKMSEVEEDVRFAKELTDRMVKVLTERSKVKPATLRKRIKGRNWWLTADDALKFGFVDAIVENLSL